MQKTTNYNLNQWEAGDAIRRADFNADNAAIDAAMTELAAAKPYVVGSYKGNNGTKEISLGFQPSFLVISGDKSAENGTYRQNEIGKYFAVSGPTSTCDGLTITQTGFQVQNDTDSYPLLSTSGRTYSYIAFR